MPAERGSMKKVQWMAAMIALVMTLSAPALAQGETLIELKDGATRITGSGAEASGSVVSITAPGEYIVTGKLTNGQITVDVGDEDVLIILNGVDIRCDFSAPIYVVSANKTEIKLEAGSENRLSDALRAVGIDDQTPTACLYSKDDMTIKGTGALVVNAENNNGIGSKNDLRINGGIITVTAANNAIKGNDSVDIRGGYITILGCEDGLKAEKADREEKGFVRVNGATVIITASDDAIQAPLAVTITNSSITTYAGDQTINCKGNVFVQDGCLQEN